MKKILVITALSLALTQLTGCAGSINREESGGLLGAVVGGVVGNQVGGGSGRDLATLVGIVAGAVAGSSIGKQLDKVDEMNAQRALETNKTNQAITWHNPDAGHDVAFTPTRTYQTSSGQYCREYQTTVSVGGKQESGYGNACRQPDGSWKIL